MRLFLRLAGMGKRRVWSQRLGEASCRGRILAVPVRELGHDHFMMNLFTYIQTQAAKYHVIIHDKPKIQSTDSVGYCNGNY